MQVVGADWARRRWLCVVLEAGKASVTSERSFAELVARFDEAAAIAVDIPVGLPDASPMRRAELQARGLVHPSTVFPTYPPPVYECPTHAQAVSLCRSRGWPGISRQSYGLWRRILEVEPYALHVHEVHPEVSFWRMNGKSRLEASKHTWNGFFERRRLLEREGIGLPDRLPEAFPATDVLDAAAAAWTAQRIADGTAETLPGDCEAGEPRIAY